MLILGGQESRDRSLSDKHDRGYPTSLKLDDGTVWNETLN